MIEDLTGLLGRTRQKAAGKSGKLNRLAAQASPRCELDPLSQREELRVPPIILVWFLARVTERISSLKYVSQSFIDKR